MGKQRSIQGREMVRSQGNQKQVREQNLPISLLLTKIIRDYFLNINVHIFKKKKTLR